MHKWAFKKASPSLRRARAKFVCANARHALFGGDNSEIFGSEAWAVRVRWPTHKRPLTYLSVVHGGGRMMKICAQQHGTAKWARVCGYEWRYQLAIRVDDVVWGTPQTQWYHPPRVAFLSLFTWPHTRANTALLSCTRCTKIWHAMKLQRKSPTYGVWI